MEAKRHMTKLVKFSSKFPSWENLKFRPHYSHKISEMFRDKRM